MATSRRPPSDTQRARLPLRCCIARAKSAGFTPMRSSLTAKTPIGEDSQALGYLGNIQGKIHL